MLTMLVAVVVPLGGDAIPNAQGKEKRKRKRKEEKEAESSNEIPDLGEMRVRKKN
jgi:hypothetical protein